MTDTERVTDRGPKKVSGHDVINRLSLTHACAADRVSLIGVTHTQTHTDAHTHGRGTVSMSVCAYDEWQSVSCRLQFRTPSAPASSCRADSSSRPTNNCNALRSGRTVAQECGNKFYFFPSADLNRSAFTYGSPRKNLSIDQSSAIQVENLKRDEQLLKMSVLCLDTCGSSLTKPFAKSPQLFFSSLPLTADS